MQRQHSPPVTVNNSPSSVPRPLFLTELSTSPPVCSCARLLTNSFGRREPAKAPPDSDQRAPSEEESDGLGILVARSRIYSKRLIARGSLPSSRRHSRRVCDKWGWRQPVVIVFVVTKLVECGRARGEGGALPSCCTLRTHFAVP